MRSLKPPPSLLCEAPSIPLDKNIHAISFAKHLRLKITRMMGKTTEYKNPVKHQKSAGILRTLAD